MNRRAPRRSRLGAFLAAAALSCAVAAIAAPAAFAHARLLSTTPQTGSTLKKQPPEVIFKFDQPVGGTAGAVRVYNSSGEEVDDLDVTHPDGRQSWMGVGLKPGLPDGTYTGTYRVISADTHIVYGGLVFNLGHASASQGVTVAGLISEEESGEVTRVAFGVVRAIDYLTIALMVGGLAFLLFAWRPGLAAAVGEEPVRTAASGAFARRAALLLGIAGLAGLAVSLLGILLQGATAAGVSLWSSLKTPIVEDTLHSRFGIVWIIRAADWVALGLLLAIAWRAPRSRRWLAAPLALGCAYLAATPAFAGHASIESPVWLMFPSDFLHVLGASVWVGGVAFLLFALPAATRQLEPPGRTRLLLETLSRFSPLALASVLAISLTGIVQAIVDVRTVSALFGTTYGLLVLAKIVLLLVLIGFGAVNRQRLIPALRRLVERLQPPGGPGLATRRSLRGELALMIAVFGVTAALVAYAPPIDTAGGPFSTTTSLGPAELEMTVEPATVGLNTVHLYLINADDGSPFTETKQLTVNASLPAQQIGPLKLQVNKAGPGHYILSGAQLSPKGTWDLELTDRVSAFDEHSTTVSVPIG